MTKLLHVRFVLVLLGLLAAQTWIEHAEGIEKPADGGLHLVSGAEFDAAVPKDFYLEGNAIPVEKRNATLLATPSGKRILVALLDTSGYSSQVQQKYSGMLIGELRLKVCGVILAAGSYGLGFNRPPQGKAGKAEFVVYDQGGQRLDACAAQEDRVLARPVPLQIVPERATKVRVYLGRYWVALEADVQ